MVESAIFFLIGFLTAALLAIAAAPAVSRRAMRLAVARARLQAPLSESQARAERDALRGKHAVETVKLEMKLEAAEVKLGQALARIGRQATEALGLNETIARLRDDVARDRSEIEALSAEQTALRAEIGARELGLHDMSSQRDRLALRLESATNHITEMATSLDRDRLVIASLETRATQLNLQIVDLRRSLATAAQDGLELQKKFADRAAELEARLADSERLREDMTLEVNRQLARLAERDAMLNSARSERDALASRLHSIVGEAEARESGLEARAQDLSTSHAAAEGALQFERKARLEMQSQIERLENRLTDAAAVSEALAKGDQTLRLAIARLGREILRARENDGATGSQIVNFTRRDPVSPAIPVSETGGGAEFADDQSVIAGS